MVDVAVIGSGFGGLGAAARLRQAGVTNVTIFERAHDLGDTWRDNTYPGCRCDVASNLYSFSFTPNPAWTNTCSYQPEIWRYLQDVTDEYQLRALIRFDHDVLDVSFEALTNPWRLTTSQGDYYARCVILASGGLDDNTLIEPNAHIASRWTRELQTKLPGTVWDTGCSSWYLNDAGVNTTIWPDFTFEFRSSTRHFDPRDHKITTSKNSEVD